MRDVLALVLAGGKGVRLEPLTRDRTSPAVPFGGCYRIIDFTLSNCINSGLRKILVLTQYKAASLDRHINLGWRFLCRELGEFIDVLPPQQRLDENWYRGTADAVYQNIYSIERAQAEHILVLSGDHIYKMDYSELMRDHIDSNADATIACLPVPVEDAPRFGVIHADADGRIVQFDEKPEFPIAMRDDPDRSLASMGIYAFRASFLFERLCRDATQSGSTHDFGRDVIPSIVDNHLVRAFAFRDQDTGVGCCWRDVGTIRRVLRSKYGSRISRPGTEPVRTGVADPHLPVTKPAAKVRLCNHRRSEPARRPRSGQHGLFGDRHLRGTGCPFDSLAKCPGEQLGESGGINPVRRCRDRPSSTRRSGFRKVWRLVVTPNGTANVVSPSPRTASP